MLPTLKDGDIIFFKNYIKGESSLKVGQIVVFNHPCKDIILIKRINSIRNNSIKVFGDNKHNSDDSSKFGYVNNEKIIGILTSKLFTRKIKDYLIQKNGSTFLNPK